eukprot:2232392-Alexandrium_andersonii.AAC.2
MSKRRRPHRTALRFIASGGLGARGLSGQGARVCAATLHSGHSQGANRNLPFCLWALEPDDGLGSQIAVDASVHVRQLNT